jgi:hypothetical protein
MDPKPSDKGQSSNRDDHRFAQVFTAQQAISGFRQAKTGGQFGHVTRELSDLDFMQ